MAVIFFDTESTGTTPNQICQLSYILADGDDAVGRNYFFTVDAMNEYAFKVHHLSRYNLQRLSDGARFEDLAGEMYADFDGCSCVVGHNVASDLKLLMDEFSRTGLNFRCAHSLCTMRHFVRAVNSTTAKGKRKQPRLEELCAHYAIQPDAIADICRQLFSCNSDWHDARWDACATYACVQAARKCGDVLGVF